MSGLYYTTPSGKRTPLLAPPSRRTRSKVVIEQAPLGAGKGLSKSRGSAIGLQKQPRRGRPRRRATSPPSDDSSTADDEQDNDDEDEDEDEEDDENKSDDDEPAVIAPAHSRTGRGTGRRVKHQTSLHLSHHDLQETMFLMSDDDDDDDIYLKVDDISDFETDEDEIEDEQELAEIWDAEDDPTAILNQLDGGSVFGFGAEYFSGEDPNALTSDSDTDAEIDLQRHVHFSADHELPRLATSSLSPLLTRALLPSALPPLEVPAGFNSSEVATGPSGHSSGNTLADSFEDGDPYDTDATADDLPPEALSRAPSPPDQNPETETVETAVPPPTSPRKKNKKRKMKAKGPPTGIFVMDNAKPWGILDASGKKVVMVPAPDSSRHLWLDAKLQKEYDATPNASPGGLLDESDRSVTSSQEGVDIPMGIPNVDIMLASLNTSRNNTDLGQATGPSEAFYPQAGFQIAGDYVISPDGLAQLGETFSDVSDEADLPLNIDDIIEFDDESSFDDESPTSPTVAMTINMPDELKGIGFGGIDNEYPHLNNRNVTAFRRNADPAQAVLNTTPTFSNFSPSEPATSRPQTPAAARKRKATDLPYQSPVYQGVTPVRRHVWEPISRKRAKTLA